MLNKLCNCKTRKSIPFPLRKILKVSFNSKVSIFSSFSYFIFPKSYLIFSDNIFTFLKIVNEIFINYIKIIEFIN